MFTQKEFDDFDYLRRDVAFETRQIIANGLKKVGYNKIATKALKERRWPVLSIYVQLVEHEAHETGKDDVLNPFYHAQIL